MPSSLSSLRGNAWLSTSAARPATSASRAQSELLLTFASVDGLSQQTLTIEQPAISR